MIQNINNERLDGNLERTDGLDLGKTVSENPV